jgi:hypothetical protein
MANANLNVILNEEVVFQSDKGWLHPLFELEEFLKSHPLDMPQADVHDKVIGKAAAMLIARMGAGSVYGDVMSKLGRDVFLQAGIPHTYGTLVARIDCRTEELLLEINDLERAHAMLIERAGRSGDDKADC